MLYREIIAVCSQIHTKHITTLCGQNVLVDLLAAFPKLRKAAIGFVMSFHPSTWNNSAPTGWTFMKFDIWVSLKKSAEKIQVSLKSDNNNGTLVKTYVHLWILNTFAARYLNTQGLNNSCLKSPASTLVDLTFQSRALRSFSLNQLRKLSL